MRKLRILAACEFSARVRDSFRELGHDAWSCDLDPCEGSSRWHIQEDVLKHLDDGWDCIIAFPPCTHLAVSGARYFAEKRRDGRQQAGIDFFMRMINAPAPHISVENPVGIMSTRYRKPDQIIGPWMFGHPTTKATCLWLKNLPLLIPTNIVDKGERRYYASGRSSPMWHANTGGGCGKQRSVTYMGLAKAMAAQWSKHMLEINE